MFTAVYVIAEKVLALSASSWKAPIDDADIIEQ
jgi:hypothetical protein